MAELALAAAAVQSIDFGARTVVLLSKILSAVKEAPDKILILRRDVQALQ